MSSDYILETKNVVKKYGSVVAVNNVNFKVERGEIHVLCGENGAGKSTLMKIISGVIPYGSYEGEFYYNGELCKFNNINDSKEKGIAIIHQHLALLPLLSIAENIFLGNEQAKGQIINWNLTRQKAKEYMIVLDLMKADTKIKDRCWQAPAR